MKKLILSSFALVAFVFASNTAYAQPGIFDKPADKTLESSFTVKIATVMAFTKTEAAGVLDLEFLSAADLTNGKSTVANAVELGYNSNWDTYMSIHATEFESLTNNLLKMPVSILSYNTAGNTTDLGTQVTESAVKIVGSDGDMGTAGAVKLTYRVTPTLKYAPANDYVSTITYTITAK